ncbi:GyrI-like domain-containing protein [Paenibacillus sp. N1-5-1-14]|uniref:GyrI-like domain-containing protein n=1 Tax=Paenibacillus radicibacter TaxID=2972488 RepID=UPI002158F236|nr:GyrI-like domain-containing protein [Paenibacillus radicibacter]MCR8644793.1 GyrI-like domain-containing protein [Paenibacillus radicibacter]
MKEVVTMHIEIIDTEEITTYVGIRATANFFNMGESVNQAFMELERRKDEIRHITNPTVTYGITPPNYKGNTRVIDFYCCYEVEPMLNLPHGMVHIHLLPRLYSLTHYVGPSSLTGTAYDYTSKWLSENGYAYDDVAYYFERYDELTIRDNDTVKNEVNIYCPVKKI